MKYNLIGLLFIILSICTLSSIEGYWTQIWIMAKMISSWKGLLSYFLLSTGCTMVLWNGFFNSSK